MVSCANCGADQFVDADADRYSCGACHQTFLLRQCPACTNVVHLADWGGRLDCPVCGHGFSHRRWAKNPVRAADAGGDPVSRATYDKPDPHHRVVAGTVVAVAGVPGLSPEVTAEIEFTSAGITIWFDTVDEEIGEHDVRYDSVRFLHVTGRGEFTTTSDAGVGRGLGLVGGLPAAGLAALVNAATRKTQTSIETFVHLRARGTEILLLETTTSPQLLSVRLGPVFDLIEEAQRSTLTASAPAESTVVDHLAKLGELHQAGFLTVDEFNAAKLRLLGR